MGIEDIRKRILEKNNKQQQIRAIDSYDRVVALKREAEGRDLATVIESIATRGKGTSFVDWVDAAVYRANELFPEFSRLLFQMTIVEANGLRTCAMDMYGRIYIDPILKDGFVDDKTGDTHAPWTCGELAYVICHEVLHWQEEHFARAQAINVKGTEANICEDLEIESILEEDAKRYGSYRDRDSHVRVRDWAIVRVPPCGNVWAMPSVASLPRLKTFEWYVEERKKLRQDQPPPPPPPPGEDEGDIKGDFPVESDEPGDEESDEPGNQPGNQPGDEPGDGPPVDGPPGNGPDGDGPTGNGPPQPGNKPWDGKPIDADDHRDTGSSVNDGIPRDYELDAPDGDRIPGITPIQAEGIRREIAKDMLAAAESRGAGSAGYRRMAERVLAVPPIPWEAKLAAVLQSSTDEPRAGKNDFTWARRARRQAAMGDFVVPGNEDFQPSLAFVRDTSGSMSNLMIGAVNRHADSILMTLDLDGTHVVDCDGAAFTPKLVQSLSDFMPSGGGGTDMRLGISAALTIIPRPRTIIVLTDGDTPWPASAPPGVHIVAVLVPHEGSERVSDATIRAVPPFITTIAVNMHARKN